ncbi:EAL domain-containing protein [Aeromonas caviae]|jgi:diguanylate cyclase (GGDEF)-like protein/PAS domain S-box-containing protein|uniref:EAL domain-containing protein n=2 Tax=Aeromonas caviae TaxID=648 RepID=A0A839D075_AERCA|nr:MULTISPECIES: EAL domain-containing protein [Aeromonas]AUV17729.1 GGDEF domain-containing protein [Aeromonas sp. ASNIH7]MBA8780557.1 EAL domain-containing protein [Aeromonas caviae]MBA8784612.1 EAL domain-containing protein [Aeromonas sp. TW 6]MBP4057576.1 EAL domain-containing protein [Aeromonas sp. Prich7-2]MCE9863474.1 EAL domain-containing protein [Aeromonas caviae]
MEKVLPESVPTRHLSGPLSPHELQQLFAQAPVGIGVFDHEFRCRDVNGRFAELTGLARAEHPGKMLFDIVPAQTPQLLPLFQQLRQGPPRCTFEVEMVGLSRAASPARWQVSVSSVLDEDGTFSGIVLVMRESAQTGPHLDAPVSPGLQEMTHLHALRLYQAEARLQHLSYYDPLTDLGNRHLLQERLTLEIETARVNHHVLALLFIDLDGFKLINDNLGHSAGDLLLKLSADRIRHCLRPGDIAIRLGADEFLVLLPAIRDTQDLLGLIEGLQRRLHDPADIGQERVRLSASIGVSLYPEHGQTPDSLISAADNAMHEAKRRGRNGYLFHSPDMTAQTRERMLLEQGLLKAIEQQEFRLLYQPMTDLADGHLSGLEALIRWQHPSLGMISPDRFIPVAEECGLIEPLGEWVMRTACRQGQQWLAEGLAVPRLSVNVSVREMRSHDYVERVTAILAETGFPAERLEIEVTESIIQSVDHSLRLFTRLKALGVQIAIDDFGTGFSSLSLLRSLPIDRIKIDRAFVQALPDDKHSRELCRTIVQLASSLGMAVTAEGIETQPQRKFLQSLRCEEGQGNLFSHPLPEPSLPPLLPLRH